MGRPPSTSAIHEKPGALYRNRHRCQWPGRRRCRRLFQPDMFSGWGIRTLSSESPAYNPYSYHRGSIWPVEHGSLSIGFMRYGLINHLHRMSRALFEAARLFEFYRLPEVFAGHSRDEEHPSPAIYPKANWPQAWSSSALFVMLQSLLGIYPFAPPKPSYRPYRRSSSALMAAGDNLNQSPRGRCLSYFALLPNQRRAERL